MRPPFPLGGFRAVSTLLLSLLLLSPRPALGQDEIRERIRESQQRLEQIRRERQQLTNEAGQLRLRCVHLWNGTSKIDLRGRAYDVAKGKVTGKAAHFGTNQSRFAFMP